jgi:hypothetical protein
MDIAREQTKQIRWLTCCCCGSETRGRQWWNRDTGYGLCPACIPLCSRCATPEDMGSLYGVRGVHYDIVPVHRAPVSSDEIAFGYQHDDAPVILPFGYEYQD